MSNDVVYINFHSSETILNILFMFQIPVIAAAVIVKMEGSAMTPPTRTPVSVSPVLRERAARQVSV